MFPNNSLFCLSLTFDIVVDVIAPATGLTLPLNALPAGVPVPPAGVPVLLAGVPVLPADALA